MNTDVNIQIGNFDDIQTATENKFLTSALTITLRVVKCFALTMGIIYGLICLMFLLFQNRLIFNPTHQLNNVPVQSTHSFANLVIPSQNGQTLTAWYIPAKNSQGTVLYCRGNRGNMSDDMHVTNTWHRLGYNVMIFDYQGFGLSSGEPSELNCYDDADAIYSWLRSNNLLNKKFIIHGKSIGAAVAANLATTTKCDGVVLESALTSIPDLGKKRFPFIPGFLFYNDFPTETYAKNIDSPVLVMHSTEDQTVPFTMGQKVFDAVPGDKSFFSLDGDHYDTISHNPGYMRALQTFAGSLKN